MKNNNEFNLNLNIFIKFLVLLPKISIYKFFANLIYDKVIILKF